MSKKNDLPEEAGKVNWDRLEKNTQKDGGRKKKKKRSAEDDLVKAVAENLSEEEKSSPYPDEFLAEINIMRSDIDGSALDLNSLEEDDDDDGEELDDSPEEEDK